MAWMDLSKKKNSEEEAPSNSEGIEKHKEQEASIVEAIADIDEELKKLRDKKSGLESSTKGVGEDITSTQAKESELRGVIANLIAKEGELEKKRTRLHEELDKTKKKIDKINKIKQDLSEEVE